MLKNIELWIKQYKEYVITAVTDFIDVRRAYFHAEARRLVYVKLPGEDNEPNMCGKLIKALYGTRDAAQNWEHAYIDFLVSIAFVSTSV